MNKAFRCPADGNTLAEPAAEGTARRCSRCEGALAGGGRLAQMVKNHGLDLEKINPDAVSPRTCPACLRPFRVYRLEDLDLDVCPQCELVWFDKGEFPRLKAVVDRTAADLKRKRDIRPAYDDPDPIGIFTDRYGWGRQPDAFDLVFDFLWYLIFRRW